MKPTKVEAEVEVVELKVALVSVWLLLTPVTEGTQAVPVGVPEQL
jgi:hypothetical protein